MAATGHLAQLLNFDEVALAAHRRGALTPAEQALYARGLAGRRRLLTCSMPVALIFAVAVVAGANSYVMNMVPDDAAARPSIMTAAVLAAVFIGLVVVLNDVRQRRAIARTVEALQGRPVKSVTGTAELIAGWRGQHELASRSLSIGGLSLYTSVPEQVLEQAFQPGQVYTAYYLPLGKDYRQLLSVEELAQVVI
jgi:hypothetical protein